MKRDELKALGITDEETMSKILGLYQAGIEQHKDKVATLEAQLTGVKGQLESANKNLEGYDPEWKTKAEQARVEAEAEIEKTLKTVAIERAIAGLKFTSKAAEKAFKSDLQQAELKLKDGVFEGLDGYVTKYKEEDPTALVGEDTSKPSPMMVIGASTQGSSAEPKDAQARANEALRGMLGS